MSSLEISHLSVSFGEKVILDDLSFSLKEGQIAALLGPSGCGKTTTLRMVAGLEEPSAGTISIGDTDITTQKSYRRNVNTVFQNYALFPHMNIFDNVAYGLRQKKISEEEVKTEVEKFLSLVKNIPPLPAQLITCDP